MDQNLKTILIDVLNGYYDSRLYNLHFMYKDYCADEEEERLYIYGMKMQEQIRIIKECLSADMSENAFLLKVMQHLVTEVLDDFYNYLSEGSSFVNDFDIEQLKSIRLLRKDFLDYPNEILKLYDRA